MKNTGVLFANDANKERIKAVVGNFHRLGVVNSVITTIDGRKYPTVNLNYTTMCFAYKYYICLAHERV
jgi:16S rRNA C967 or C1407 C5-methylase (RsmB/RsmF family)